mmetsp:Transcript_103477/g.194679  ORF Transcript_103477/g.194679 Transcript_103477/m.194679 type:complete len:958 (-) Transcript_103477:33-2906(-)
MNLALTPKGGKEAAQPKKAGTMARRDPNQFPYMLTFCRPCHKSSEEGAKQVFAVVSDGFHDCRITVWPRLGLPFPMNYRRTLIIRVFAAKDENAFDRGDHQEVAICFLPLWKVPEVCPGVSAQGLSEIWLSLDVPRPPRLGSAKAGSLDAGGEVRVEVEAELLGHFERSRELAAANPNCPKICIIVQARSDIAVAMSAMLRPSSSGMTPPVSTSDLLGALPESAAASFLRSSMLSDSQGTRAFQTPTTPKASGRSPGRSDNGSPDGSARSATPMGKAAVSPSTSARQTGQSTSPTATARHGDGFWRSRWEEERQRHEEMRKKYSKDLQLAKKHTNRRSGMLMQMGTLLEACWIRSWKNSAFDAWSWWVSEEQRRRQFLDLADNESSFKTVRDSEIGKLRAALEEKNREQRAHEQFVARRLQRRMTELAGAHKAWDHDDIWWLQVQVLVAWHRTAGRGALHQRMSNEQAISGRRWVVYTIVCAWKALVGQQRLDEFTERVFSEEKEMPARARKACSIQVLRTHDWAEDLPEQDGKPPRLLSEAFSAWARTAGGDLHWRDRMTQLCVSQLRRSVETIFAATCLVMWRGAVSKTEVAMATERDAGREAAERCRRRAWGILEAWYMGSNDSSAHALLLCWHFYAARAKLQKTLEKVFTEQQDDHQQFGKHKEELELVQASLRKEKALWLEERQKLLEELQCEELELEASGGIFRKALEERTLAEEQRSEAAVRTQELMSELASTQAQTLQAAESLQAAEESLLKAESEAVSREEIFEEESAAAQLQLPKLQAEAVRHRERRQRDVKEARQRLRTQTQRHEDSRIRLEKGHENDRAAWVSKLEYSEARVERLEREISERREHLQAIPGRIEAKEAENGELLKKCEKVEESLRQVEQNERSKRSELATLRSAQEELQSQCEELERHCSYGGRYWKGSPLPPSSGVTSQPPPLPSLSLPASQGR